MSLEDWAREVAATVYRVSLYGQLTGRTPPRRYLVSDEEFAEAIRESRVHASEIDGQEMVDEMVDLATAAALKAYDMVIACNIEQAHAQRPH